MDRSAKRLKRGPMGWFFQFAGLPGLLAPSLIVAGVALLVAPRDDIAWAFVVTAFLLAPAFLTRTTLRADVLEFGIRLRPVRIPLRDVEEVREGSLPTIRGYLVPGIKLTIDGSPRDLPTSIHLGRRRREQWMRDIDEERLRVRAASVRVNGDEPSA